tara:strand:- start:3070 stop:3510 length:441 start_codon:yes stop_codon:yes gene_type:complete
MLSTAQRIFNKEIRLEKLFVDVDDTLLLYTAEGVSINWDLVDILSDGLWSENYDITVWSATGKDWAKEWSEKLFYGFNLPSGSKEELWKSVPTEALAIDDRLQHEREYLSRFRKVFLPEDFIKINMTSKLLAKNAFLGDSGNETFS